MYHIAILAGDGIGPEVMEQAERVLKALEKKYSLKIEKTHALVGGAAFDALGEALPPKTLDACKNSDAILFGSVGGPKWDALPPHQQPERGALLPLRKHFDLFANLRPAIIFESLKAASPLQAHLIPENFDILIVRELTGGIYFGEPKTRENEKALDTLIYHKHEIERIARVAFEAARGRGKTLVSIDKANVLTSMVFWREVVQDIAKDYADVQLSHMYVDNAAMQLVARPAQFDVLLCPNMFGDILSDEASIITGSLGMLPSASLSQSQNKAGARFGLYEPAGGSAPDIAGKGIANPIAQILSLAMLCKYSLGLDEAYEALRTAVDTVLKKGFRTRDIMSHGCVEVGTEEMGQHIVDALSA